MLPTYIPEGLRRAAKSTGQIPLRWEGAPGTPFEGEGKWRSTPNFEHATLCRVFGLDPIRFWFDMPSSVRGIGANQTGHGGGASARRISGFVMMAGWDRPVAKISVCIEDEKFKDVDPASQSDFYDLSHA